MIRVKVIVRVTDYSQGKLMVIISVMVKLGLGLEFYPNNLVTITLTPKLTLAIYTTKYTPVDGLSVHQMSPKPLQVDS